MAMKQSAPDYLVLGHITQDLLAGNTCISGGTALYAAITAQRLGLNTAILTAAAKLPADLPASIEIICIPSVTTSTFANRYTDHIRQQFVHAVAPPLDLDLIPAAWHASPIVHLGPVLHECSLDMLFAFPQAIIGVTPQGWMRQWHPPLPSLVTQPGWKPDPALLRVIDVLVISTEDVSGDPTSLAYYTRYCRLVALTHGADGVTLFVDGEAHHIPAHPAIEVDPTGAGDVFAAALLIRLRETGNPFASVRFAAIVAALSVEGMGVSCIPTRETVLSHMGALNDEHAVDRNRRRCS